MVLLKHLVYSILTFYSSASYLILNHTHNTTHKVIDEEFHIPQGLAYCNFNFSTWDPKITTLPGLYILSTLILGPLNFLFGPLNLCSTYWLRFVNYIAGILNLCLFFVWFSIADPNISLRGRFLALFSSFNLSILPPLFFFTNIYYTDVVSVMFIMLMLIFNKLERHIYASLCGLVSVMIRQTNIIWVAMLFGEYVLKQFHYYCVKSKRKRYEILEITEEDIKDLLTNLGKIFIWRNTPKEIMLNIYAYLVPIIMFVIFVMVNGGVVVGDKTAHVAVIHIPQLFYFSLFCLIFGWPHFLHLVIPFLKRIYKNMFSTLIIIILMIIIVYLNTLVHPYLLADNRHYTFYIWNRFYQKIFIFRYVIVPVYVFGLYSIFHSIYCKSDITFALVYIPCTIFVLVLQKMIEVRYFLIPFIILRSKISCKSGKLLFAEMLTYLILNVASFVIFFTKDIYWTNFDYAQKIIW